MYHFSIKVPICQCISFIVDILLSFVAGYPRGTRPLPSFGITVQSTLSQIFLLLFFLFFCKSACYSFFIYSMLSFSLYFFCVSRFLSIFAFDLSVVSFSNSALFRLEWSYCTLKEYRISFFGVILFFLLKFADLIFFYIFAQ